MRRQAPDTHLGAAPLQLLQSLPIFPGQLDASRNDEEIDRDEVSQMVLKERAPGLRGRFRATRHQPGTRALRDLEAELEQLAVNARRAPERIRQRHGAHEFSKLRADPWSTHSLATGLPGPESAEALPVPANHGRGANEMERLSPPSPLVGEPHPEEAIEAPELRSLRVAAEHGKLLPERQVLERGRCGFSGQRAGLLTERGRGTFVSMARTPLAHRPVSGSSFGKRQERAAKPRPRRRRRKRSRSR